MRHPLLVSLQKLEKSHQFWILLGLCILFFVLRLPSLFEPQWYGDEGIYQTIGLAIKHGEILYSQIWDNKPPLLYITYALGNGSLFYAKLLSMLSGIGAVITIFLLAKRNFKSPTSPLLVTLFFTIFFGLPFFEGNIANAENFMLFPVLLAGLIINKITDKGLNARPLFLSGLLLGFAFLYKIVAIFDFAAFFLFISIISLPDELKIRSILAFCKKLATPLIAFTLGAVIPFLISVVYFSLHHALKDYLQATFSSTVGYVGYNNVFLIPQGLLILKLFFLAVGVFLIFIKRKTLLKNEIFILLWTMFSLFNCFFSQRPYTHYFLVLLPALSLLLGGVLNSTRIRRISALLLFIGISTLSLSFFDHWSITKTTGYYKNFIAFETGRNTLNQYQSFFDRRTPHEFELTSYINSQKNFKNTLYVWGNSAQLYYATNSVPPGRFTVAYHISGNEKYLKETQVAIDKINPSYIVIQSGTAAYPFSLYNYRHALTISGNAIYERVF